MVVLGPDAGTLGAAVQVAGKFSLDVPAASLKVGDAVVATCGAVVAAAVVG